MGLDEARVALKRRLKAFFLARSDNHFTGAIKVNFSAGLIDGVTEANGFDTPMSFFNKSMLDDLLDKVTSSMFYGNAIIVYSNGRMCSYGYWQTIKDDAIARLLQEGIAKPRRVAKRVEKADLELDLR